MTSSVKNLNANTLSFEPEFLYLEYKEDKIKIPYNEILETSYVENHTHRFWQTLSRGQSGTGTDSPAYLKVINVASTCFLKAYSQNIKEIKNVKLELEKGAYNALKSAIKGELLIERQAATSKEYLLENSLTKSEYMTMTAEKCFLNLIITPIERGEKKDEKNPKKLKIDLNQTTN